MVEHVIGNDATRVQFSFSAHGNKKKSVYKIAVHSVQELELLCAQVQDV